eukprot:scaffold55592_cov68-Phaeocystis_antarctica.AAC.3
MQIINTRSWGDASLCSLPSASSASLHADVQGARGAVHGYTWLGPLARGVPSKIDEGRHRARCPRYGY